MKKLLGIEVDLDIFDDSLAVLWGDKDQLGQYLKDKQFTLHLRTIDDLESGFVDGMCFSPGEMEDKSFIWIGKDLKNYSVVCHELMHGILSITHKRNLFCSDTPGTGEQELECYLVGYVMNKVLGTPKKTWLEWNGTKWVKQKGV